MTFPSSNEEGWRPKAGWSSNHELPRDHHQNSVEILDDFTILESDQPDSGPFKKPRADGIALLCSVIVVSRTVQLHGEPFSGTVEVQNVGPDAVLASKFPAPETPAFEMVPQARFRDCESSAKFATSWFESRNIMNKSHARSTLVGDAS